MIEQYLLTSSLREFFRPKRLIIWIVVAFFGMGLAAVWPTLSPDSTKADQYSVVIEILTFHFLALSSAIFTTSVVSQEVEQKTIVYLLTRPIARWKILIFRYLASAVVVAALAILGAIFVSIGVYKGQAFSNPLLLRDLFAVVVGAFAYGAVFLLVSLLFNRAMIICLLYAFGWETSVPKMPGEMYRLSIYSHIQAISQHPAPSTDNNVVTRLLTASFSTNLISSSVAIATLILATVALVSVSSMWFSKFEYVPREDAE